MSDSVRPHRQQPTRIPRHWDSPGKNTGVGWHFLLQKNEDRYYPKAWNVGNLCSIPVLGRPPGEGNGYLLQYPSLENSMDCIVHGVTKSWTGLTFTFTIQKRSSPDAILGLSRPSFFWLQKNISEIFLPYLFQRSSPMQSQTLVNIVIYIVIFVP